MSTDWALPCARPGDQCYTCALICSPSKHYVVASISEEETEAQKDQISCLRSKSQQVSLRTPHLTLWPHPHPDTLISLSAEMRVTIISPSQGCSEMNMKGGCFCEVHGVQHIVYTQKMLVILFVCVFFVCDAKSHFKPQVGWVIWLWKGDDCDLSEGFVSFCRSYLQPLCLLVWRETCGDLQWLHGGRRPDAERLCP